MSKSKKTKVTRVCWPHPLLEIKPGLFPVAGSACGAPVVDDYDIYIGFDRMRFTTRHLPWEPGVEIEYFIPDMSAPTDLKTYRKLVDWTLEQLESGARIHVGCIGGHGRTGMFLAALVATATSRKDAITYVREQYCVKACETATQIDFLVKNYGVDSVSASKVVMKIKGGWGKSANDDVTEAWLAFSDDVGSVHSVVPLKSARSIWGDEFDTEDGFDV